MYHERTKHIEIVCHFIREQHSKCVIITSFVKFGKQVADVFTKALGKS